MTLDEWRERRRLIQNGARSLLIDDIHDKIDVLYDIADEAFDYAEQLEQERDALIDALKRIAAVEGDELSAANIAHVALKENTDE